MFYISSVTASALHSIIHSVALTALHSTIHSVALTALHSIIHSVALTALHSIIHECLPARASYEEIIRDLEQVEATEQFERAHNFRFEEQDGGQLINHSREVPRGTSAHPLGESIL